MNTPKKNFSCIIPAFNESKRICGVLEPFIKHKIFQEIIVVDDGSSDDLKKVISNYLKTHLSQNKKTTIVRYIRLRRNSGKTNAVKIGVEAAQNELIVLFDADSYDIHIEDVEKGMKYFVEKNCDLLIFSKNDQPAYVKAVRGNICWSGERIIRKKDLLEILKSKPVKYQLEVAINKYALENNFLIEITKLESKHNSPYRKYKFFKALKKDLDMMKDIFQYTNIKDLAAQHIKIKKQKF